MFHGYVVQIPICHGWFIVVDNFIDECFMHWLWLGFWLWNWLKGVGELAVVKAIAVARELHLPPVTSDNGCTAFETVTSDDHSISPSNKNTRTSHLGLPFALRLPICASKTYLSFIPRHLHTESCTTFKPPSSSRCKMSFKKTSISMKRKRPCFFTIFKTCASATCSSLLSSCN